MKFKTAPMKEEEIDEMFKINDFLDLSDASDCSSGAMKLIEEFEKKSKNAGIKLIAYISRLEYKILEMNISSKNAVRLIKGRKK